ncbi:MAG: LLM class flavin-dependent oxidoreductase [Chloroflexota bacterium]|nr:LLM class flavin-dependent oxidoreductase [Chloroflexota bacterium]
MYYGINLPPFGDLGDPRVLADLAREAEVAGWDGFFIWDHMIFDPSFYPIVDPIVALAAVAVNTSRIRLGTLVTPLPRRRPWKLARETVSLDRLSGGRLILGVGIGNPAQWEYGFFGEQSDAKVRADQLDEGLDILTGLWSGELFSYQGEHYQLNQMRFLPRPLQSPRIPIWVGGNWPNKPPFRRAARWDGMCPSGRDGPLTPDDWRELRAYVDEFRTSDAPFDLVCSGETSSQNKAQDADSVVRFIEAGCTWWIEEVSPWRFGWKWEDALAPDATRMMRERVLLGPPQR